MGIVALAGGVGGAKLAQGLYLALPAESLSVVVNTGDDFDLYGLHISPDADTVLYTLAGVANSETGWGVAGDTFATLDMLRRYGLDPWFQLGDRDFATHILRTQRLRAGEPLSAVLAELARALGVHARLLPMTDTAVPTIVRTPAGELAFQEYFVRRRQRDDVLGVRFDSIETARMPDAVATALREAEAIVFCPSNPIVSIGPILAVPGMREAVRGALSPVVAVSPIVAGAAVRGPAARMLRGLGHDVSALGVARLYQEIADGIVIDVEDAALAPAIEALGLAVLVTPTLMRDTDDRIRLAGETLRFAARLQARHT